MLIETGFSFAGNLSLTHHNKMLVGLGPEYSPDSSRALGVEGGQLVEVALGHPLAF